MLNAGFPTVAERNGFVIRRVNSSIVGSNPTPSFCVVGSSKCRIDFGSLLPNMLGRDMLPHMMFDGTEMKAYVVELV